MAISVTFECKEFQKAAKRALAIKPDRGGAALEYVDLNALRGEVELVVTGVSERFTAQVSSGGYARFPYTIFQQLVKGFRKLPGESLVLSIQEGQLKVGSLRFRHPAIQIRQIATRIADLPAGASLSDVLTLPENFSTGELEDSALAARVLEAQKRAADLIDKAANILVPFGIDRDTVSAFVLEQIRNPTQKRKLYL